MKMKGMGLLELLLAISVLGALGMVIARFSQNANKVTHNVDVNNDIVVITQQIQAVLAEPENCTTTFQGKRANNMANAVQSLRLKNDSVFVDTFETKTQNPSMTYGQKLVKINSFDLSDAAEDVDVTTLGTTHLIVSFDRGTKGSQTQTISKKINLRVVVNASGDIVSCTAFNSSGGELWKYATNNSDIYYAGGSATIGQGSPGSNLTIHAKTMPLTSGVSIIGNENATPGWNRAGVYFEDPTSTHAWAFSTYGSASFEGEGKFGINGGPKGSPIPNKMVITKDGDFGLGTKDPYCGFSDCTEGIDFHVHNPNPTGAAGLMLSSNATAINSLVGAIAFGTMQSPSVDKRVGVITGNITSLSPFKGSLVFWTSHAGLNQWNMILDPTGNIWLRGETTAASLATVSDRRLKKNIRPLNHSLKEILKLQGVSFHWKNKKWFQKQLGFIAQEVEKVFPEVVSENDQGFKSLAYLDLVSPLVDAIQEMNSLFLKREKDLSSIRSDNEEMKKYLCMKDKTANFCTRGTR